MPQPIYVQPVQNTTSQSGEKAISTATHVGGAVLVVEGVGTVVRPAVIKGASVPVVGQSLQVLNEIGHVGGAVTFSKAGVPVRPSGPATLWYAFPQSHFGVVPNEVYGIPPQIGPELTAGAIPGYAAELFDANVIDTGLNQFLGAPQRAREQAFELQRQQNQINQLAALSRTAPTLTNQQLGQQLFAVQQQTGTPVQSFIVGQILAGEVQQRQLTGTAFLRGATFDTAVTFETLLAVASQAPPPAIEAALAHASTFYAPNKILPLTGAKNNDKAKGQLGRDLGLNLADP